MNKLIIIYYTVYHFLCISKNSVKPIRNTRYNYYINKRWYFNQPQYFPMTSKKRHRTSPLSMYLCRYIIHMFAVVINIYFSLVQLVDCVVVLVRLNLFTRSAMLFIKFHLFGSLIFTIRESGGG